MNSNHPARPILFSLADQSFSRTKSIGILNVSLGLARALAAARPAGGLILLSNEELHDGLPPVAGSVRVERFDRAHRSRLARIWYDQVGVYRFARRHPGAWLLLPKGYASFLLPPPSSVRLVCYVHDAMQWHYRQHHPGYFSRLESEYFWRGFQATLRHSHLILTNSKFTQREVESYATKAGLRCPPTACVGIGFDPVRPESGVRRSGLLVLASRVPHKRTRQAAEWLARWQDATQFKPLVYWVGSMPDGVTVAGRANWRHEPRLADAAYHQLLGSSQAVVYFSEYEGFGMPPVEAILHGAVPVYSDLPVIREVLAGMGQPFANESYDSFADALTRSLGQLPSAVEAWRFALEAKLGWAAVADRVLRALHQVTNPAT